MNFKALIAAGALLASQSFAIIGIGGHYAPSFGNKMNGMDKMAPVTDDGAIQIQHEGFSGLMHGFGFKAWVDILPIIDIEATFNIQFGSYDASLFIAKNPLAPVADDPEQFDKIDLKVELGGVPFAEANPKFVHMNGDLSVTYPITFLPIIRPYIGGGITYNMNTFILNQSFTYGIVNGLYAAVVQSMQDELAAAIANGDPAAIAGIDPNQLAERVQGQAIDNIKDAALEEGLKTSIGGHVLVGMRAKLPIIPIAAYANFKYYFGGDYPKEFEYGNMAVEIGGGFAL